MTVKELMEELKKYDENLEVVGYYNYIDDDMDDYRETVSDVDSVELSDDNSCVYINCLSYLGKKVNEKD